MLRAKPKMNLALVASTPLLKLTLFFGLMAQCTALAHRFEDTFSGPGAPSVQVHLRPEHRNVATLSFGRWSYMLVFLGIS